MYHEVNHTIEHHLPVDGEVESHEFNELRFCVAHHVSIVCRPVQVTVNWGHLVGVRK